MNVARFPISGPKRQPTGTDYLLEAHKLDRVGRFDLSDRFLSIARAPPHLGSLPAGRGGGMNWTPELDSELKALIARGLSFGQIKIFMGLRTRSQAIGRAHRLGLPHPHGKHAPRPYAPRTPRRTTKPRALPEVKPFKRDPHAGRGFNFRTAKHTFEIKPIEAVEAVVLASDPPPGARLSLLELNAHTCRWPLGNPGDEDFGFCGAHTAAIYCSAHAAIAFNQTQRQIFNASKGEPNG